MATADFDAEELDLFIRSAVDRNDVPGISLSYWSESNINTLCAGQIRQKSPDLIHNNISFPIGCLGKLIISAMCAEIIALGAISKDDYIYNHLNEFANIGGKFSHITIGHLLNHTSGLIDPPERPWRWNLDWDSLVEYLKTDAVRFYPGENWSYSQIGHIIISKIMEKIRNKPFEELRDIYLERILGEAPIQTPDRRVALHIYSGQRQRYEELHLPADKGLLRRTISPLALSPFDTARLARAISPFAPDGASPLAASARALITTPTTAIAAAWSPPGAEAIPTSYGLGIGLYPQSFGHSGSYVGSTMVAHISNTGDAGVVVALNAWRYDLRDAVAFGVLRRLSPAHTPAAAPAAHAFHPPMASLAGAYQGHMMGAGSLTIQADGRCAIENQGRVVAAHVRRHEHGYWIDNPETPFASGIYQDQTSGQAYVRVGASIYSRRDLAA